MSVLNAKLDEEIVMKVWVLTREENRYDQCGEYFDAVFSTKPTVRQLMPHVGDSKTTAEHVLSSGGGRISDEDTWYFLREIDC